VGVIAAIAASPLVAETGTPVIPGLLAAVTVSLLAAVGVLAGWYPARAAARLDPVLALRS
jgi:ABC-type antimicrobial peptide transport system permease subunit